MPLEQGLAMHSVVKTGKCHALQGAAHACIQYLVCMPVKCVHSSYTTVSKPAFSYFERLQFRINSKVVPILQEAVSQ